MIAVVYGEACGFLVEPVAGAVAKAFGATGVEAAAVTVESLERDRLRAESVERFYVLPFDPPAGQTPAEYLGGLMPAARPVVSFAIHELCLDRVAVQARLLERGLPMPETIITTDPDDVYDFVREHEWAVLKPVAVRAGATDFVVWREGDELLGDCGSHVYRLQLVADGEPLLVGDRFLAPGPFYLQRLVAGYGRKKVEAPQVLRAYVADFRVRFWTERSREQPQRPSDLLLAAARGARHRFLSEVGDEANKIAQRSADALGVRFGVIDLLRTTRDGPYVIGALTDGSQLHIARTFKQLPEYRSVYDFDHFVAEAVVERQREHEAEQERRANRPPPPPRADRRGNRGRGRNRPF